ncbi:MAG: InlB B-repeat-containing protein, partial [Inhella sp.]
MRRDLRSSLLVLAAGALLAACGGGGGATEVSELAPPAPAPALPPPAPNPPVPPSPAPTPPASEPPGPVVLSVSLSGAGRGEVGGNGIACGGDCEETLDPGATVTLRAQAAAGFVFDGWGGACQGLQTECQLTLVETRSVVASFVPARVLDQPVDRLIAAMPVNSWLRLSGTRLGDACPEPYQGYYCSSVVKAWSGGAYDERRDRLIVYGGGHSDSYYNNLFSFDLASMRWERLNEMGGGATGVQPGRGWTVIALETCGFYPKGDPVIPDSALLLPGKSYVDPAKCLSEPIRS